MPKEKLFQIGVKALITNKKGEILVLDSGEWHLKHQTRHWDIPGGRIQEGHDLDETLRREIEEETGITEFEAGRLFTAVISNFKDIPVGEHKVGLALFIFRVEIPENSQIKLSNEHSGFEWVGPVEAAKRLAYKYPAEFTDLIATI